MKSINPYNQQLLKEFEEYTDARIDEIIHKSDQVFHRWRKSDFSIRAGLMNKLADHLKENTDHYARIISLEMGKPIKESRAEITKCAWVCDYYASNAEDFLKDEVVKTDASRSYKHYKPLGTILSVMPWNFPFWQVFRFAAPTIMAGNVALLKHASIVPQCAIAIENAFKEAGFPEGLFRSLLIGSSKMEPVINDSRIKAVTLTGSEKAGAIVAQQAGKQIKKTVLELGGSNPFIVMDDANITESVETGIHARYMNTGQSCIAAKRFIIHKNVYDDFLEKYLQKVKNLKSGDPLDDETQIGVLANTKQADIIEEQVQSSVKAGAKILTGGEKNKAYYSPTVLTDVKPGMKVFDEETFGPVAAFIKANSTDEIFELSNNSGYGLGVSICTSDVTNALQFIDDIDDGAVFFNEIVKSDPRLPFGGTKQSGYGRELSKEGIHEFVNLQTIYIK